MSPDIRPLIDRIIAQSRSGGPWSLSSPEIASLLGIDEPEIYRRAYSSSLGQRAVLDLSVVMGSFTADNTAELLSLLELFYGKAAERDLEHAGLFFCHERRIDIAEVFLSTASRRIGAHAIDEPKFSAMLRSYGRYEAARYSYLAGLPSLEALVREAADTYCRGKVFGSPELAHATVEATLRLFLRRKVLSLEDVLWPLVSRLRAQAVREGYVHAARREAEEPGETKVAGARAERERAQRALELEGKKLTAETLRSQYRRLMKRYHPDVNPQGLERSKQINAAYSLLMAALAG